MIEKAIIPFNGCIPTIFTVDLYGNNSSAYTILNEDFHSYLDSITNSLSTENTLRQRDWFHKYSDYLKNTGLDKNPTLKQDINFLIESTGDAKTEFLLSKWLEELNSYHQQQSSRQKLYYLNQQKDKISIKSIRKYRYINTSKLLSTSVSNVLLNINEEKSIVAPLYMSMFFQKVSDQQPLLISYPSISNLFDLFDDDWFDAIDQATTSAFNEFGYKLVHPEGQLAIRWALDLSDYYQALNVTPDNAGWMIRLNKLPRTIMGRSAGSAFAICTLQLLARAYLNHSKFFQS